MGVSGGMGGPGEIAALFTIYDFRFAISDLRFRMDWAWLADFTLISAIYVCLLRQIRGYFNIVLSKSQQKRAGPGEKKGTKISDDQGVEIRKAGYQGD